MIFSHENVPAILNLQEYKIEYNDINYRFKWLFR